VNPESPAEKPMCEMIETDCVIVTAPYPPESRTMTSPPASVSAIAAPKLRHGEGREQGLASIPEPAETNVRCAAFAATVVMKSERKNRRALLFTAAPPFGSRTAVYAISFREPLAFFPAAREF